MEGSFNPYSDLTSADFVILVADKCHFGNQFIKDSRISGQDTMVSTHIFSAI